MMTNGGEPVRMAGMRLGLGPADIVKLVSNPSEITARVRYQQAFPRS
jgi:hypothetical protein